MCSMGGAGKDDERRRPGSAIGQGRTTPGTPSPIGAARSSKDYAGAMALIDCFDLREGWSKVPDPLGESWKSFDDAIAASGYDVFMRYVEENATMASMTVYQHATDDAFLVMLDSFDTWRLIMAADLPSLIDLHRQLSPMLQLSLASGLYEMARELYGLLTEYRRGPLADVLQAREDRREYYSAMRQKNKTAG